MTTSTKGPTIVEVLEALSSKLNVEGLSKDAADVFRAALIVRLFSVSSSLEVSEEASVKWPCLKAPDAAIKAYADSIVVAESSDGWTVAVDPDRLAEKGLSAELPAILEFGDPGGVAATPHWRPTMVEFELDTTRNLEKKYVDDVHG